MALDAFDIELGLASEQGSQMWIDLRAGRFTSSEMWKLMESGTREMNAAEKAARPKSGKGSKTNFVEDPSCLSKTTETYIRTKVAETLTGQCSPNVFSHATAHGDEMEPYAAEEFAKRYNVEYEILSFVPFGEHSGGSPDRKIRDSNILLEIKAPYNSTNQINYLMLTDQYDLKRNNPEHYWQCMSNMLFCNAEKCYFATYDHRMKDPKHQLFVMEIFPKSEDFDRIIIKLEAAIKEKLELIKLLS